MDKDASIFKGLLVVFFLFVVILSFIQFSVKDIIGFDGYLHIKAADLIKENGFFKEFPWTVNSILNTKYADIQLLFRLALIPFTFFGLINGAKIAAIVFGASCFTVFYWYLKKNGITFPLIWTFIYLLASVELMYRFLLPRAMPLSVLFLILTFYFVEEKKLKSLFALSFLYVWLYSAFLFSFMVVLLSFVLDWAMHKKIDHSLLVYSIGGIMAGLIINPYFPNNLTLLYLQLFKVNLLGNLFNVEWQPWSFGQLLFHNIVPFICFFAAIFFNAKNKKISKKNLLLFLISLIFLIFTIKSKRMQEYFVPFAVLFLAFSINDFIIKLNEKKADYFKYLKYSFIFIIIVLAPINYINLEKTIDEGNFLYKYEKGALWLKNNAPKGSLVFINAYAFNYLFFYNSDVKYTHGIDLTYSYLYDADKFERYMDLLQGKDFDYNVIKTDYNPDYVFIGKIKPDKQIAEFILKFKKDFELEYEDDFTAIFKVKK